MYKQNSNPFNFPPIGLAQYRKVNVPFSWMNRSLRTTDEHFENSSVLHHQDPGVLSLAATVTLTPPRRTEELLSECSSCHKRQQHIGERFVFRLVPFLSFLLTRTRPAARGLRSCRWVCLQAPRSLHHKACVMLLTGFLPFTVFICLVS